MEDIVDRLEDLLKQATVERSHYYVGRCAKDAIAEIKQLRLANEDHKNVLKAALYNEPNGVELVNRLTAYALSQRKTAEATGN
jgi:hypothetical protein